MHLVKMEENVNLSTQSIDLKSVTDIDVQEQLKTQEVLNASNRQRPCHEHKQTETDAFDVPSPSSSSTASLINSTDATFEPTIDMMVNDFDDEQTLNEEESLAALEAQDPQDEIDTLKAESEMPLEELLAKFMPKEAPCRKRKIKIPGVKRTKLDAKLNVVEPKTCPPDCLNDVIVIESGDEDHPELKEIKCYEDDFQDETFAGTELNASFAECSKQNGENIFRHKAKIKPRRSHLFDLYSDESFSTVMGREVGKDAALDLYEDDEEEDEETDDYVRKTIMVGAAYQAVIPDGLSQYGDVLPYENEDKLVWEPSQVSEHEVEEYLQKVRDIKSTLQDDDQPKADANRLLALHKNVNNTSDLSTSLNDIQIDSKDKKSNASNSDSDTESNAVVKDNEQALHLLVQCGYDFKEALRRKRLNALPLSDTMSLWSEEECHKFEDGIKKFGKDFLSIRQNLVRTRSMRELVQFYYLWKKSERHDQNCANTDTVDHMDIYLNEGGEYGPSTIHSISSTGASTASILSAGCRKSTGLQKKNFSIMIGSTTSIQQNTTISKAINQVRTSSRTVSEDSAGILPTESSSN